MNSVIIFAQTVDPSSPLDWGVLGVIAVSIIASVGSGVKKIIDWLVSKVTAPDTRIGELEKEKAQRELEDRARFLKLETDVENLRAEIAILNAELKISEIARARTEGELDALKKQIAQNTRVINNTPEDNT